MQSKMIRDLLIWIVSFQVIGFLLGKMTETNISTWYQYLNKPPLNPPQIVFPIAWSVLYVMLAVAGWYLWENRQQPRARLALVFFSIQMIMNWLWTPLFFQWHMMQLGFYCILGIIFFSLATIFVARKQYLLVTLMLTPYIFWLMFAGYLNGWIWMNN